LSSFQYCRNSRYSNEGLNRFSAYSYFPKAELDQFVVFQNALNDGDLITCSKGRCGVYIDSGNLRMADEVKQITIEDILSDYHRKILSPTAVKFYAAVWFRMGNRGVTEISMPDEEISVRAKVPMSAISRVQSELARASLLQIFSNGNETKYKFISDPDNPNLDGRAPTAVEGCASWGKMWPRCWSTCGPASRSSAMCGRS
jgi:hypothetical protein